MPGTAFVNLLHNGSLPITDASTGKELASASEVATDPFVSMNLKSYLQKYDINSTCAITNLACNTSI